MVTSLEDARRRRASEQTNATSISRMALRNACREALGSFSISKLFVAYGQTVNMGLGRLPI